MIKTQRSNLFLAAAVLLLWSASPANSGDLVLVINGSLGNIRSITAKEVKRLYLGKTIKLNGVKVKPYRLFDRDPVRKTFIKEIMGMKSAKLKIYWLKEALKGGARPPKAKRNYKSLISSVRREKGGIGYLSSDMATESGLTTVKIDQ